MSNSQWNVLCADAFLVRNILSQNVASALSLRLHADQTHHNDEGNGHGENGGHHNRPSGQPKTFKAIKPYYLPIIATVLMNSVSYLPLIRAIGIDANMQIYRLPSGAGCVPEHVDEDFPVHNGLALYSVIVYLNDDFEGGETILDGYGAVNSLGVGDGLVFRHSLRHSGNPVNQGVKFVLKTDVICQ